MHIIEMMLHGVLGIMSFDLMRLAPLISLSRAHEPSGRYQELSILARVQ
jgi:hypothetical protein